MAEQKKGKALADNKEKSPVQIKEAQTVKPSPMKKNTEKMCRWCFKTRIIRLIRV